MRQQKGLQNSIKDVESSLLDQLQRRETLLKESRDVISSCSRAIIGIHNRKTTEAVTELATARKLLTVLKKTGEGSLSRYLISAETEFVEASTVYALTKREPVPSRSALDASPEAYVLGLLDTVGELKRLVLDSLMQGKTGDAKAYFESMELLYSTCSPLAVYDHVVNGVRRKLDVARMLVEDTRGLLAQEMGMEDLRASMKELYKKLESSG